MSYNDFKCVFLGLYERTIEDHYVPFSLVNIFIFFLLAGSRCCATALRNPRDLDFHSSHGPSDIHLSEIPRHV